MSKVGSRTKFYKMTVELQNFPRKSNRIQTFSIFRCFFEYNSVRIELIKINQMHQILNHSNAIKVRFGSVQGF